MKEIREMNKEELIAAIINNNGLSVSHATMRNEDLIPTFVSVLFKLNPSKVRNLWKSDENLLQALCDKNAEIETSKEYWESDDATEVCEWLFDSLNAESPNGFYFGSHIGDGSDYGFWRNDDDDE